MIVDTSVLVAILKAEPGFETYVRLLATTGPNLMSAGTRVEASVVALRSEWADMAARLGVLIEIYEIQILPFTERQSVIASEAYRAFGKGSGHSAQLNFGDCFAYALAKDRGEPLLFKGDDFAQTDVMSAL